MSRLCLGIYGLAVLLALPQNVLAQQSCIDISSREGWQRIEFQGEFRPYISDVSGGWTVDSRSFSLVGPSGHAGADSDRLAPFDEYKYNREFNFGALLSRSANGQVVAVGQGSHMATRSMDFRINDSDGTLADNDGNLQVCFATDGVARFSDPMPAQQVTGLAAGSAEQSQSPAGSGQVSAACQAERDELDRLWPELEEWRAELNGERRRLNERRRRLEENARYLSLSVGDDPYGVAGNVRQYNIAEHEQEVREFDRDNDDYNRESAEFNREADDYNRRSAAARECR